MDAEVPVNYVAQLSGHKNLKSLETYKTASDEHQRKMSLVLVLRHSIENRSNSKFKHDVYSKRQTAKMKLFLFLISCVYRRVKLFVFEMNISRRYSISVCFVHGLEEKDSKSEVIFAVCRKRHA